MTILLLSKEQDGHVEPIAQLLRARGCDVLIMDLADVPLSASVMAFPLNGWSGNMRIRERDMNLEQVTSIWWRRPTSPVPPDEYTAAEAAFWIRENERGFTGLLLAPGHPFWVSNPDAIHAAARKPRQLATAQALGLAIPRTLITNDPAAVRTFYEECCGQMIVKAICRGIIDAEGAYVAGQERYIYTSAVQQEHLEHLEQVSMMLHLFQERLVKQMDLRVVVIGRQVFAIEIHAPARGPAALDWRRDYASLVYQPHHLPQEIERKVLQLVRGLGLQFSSMDFILSQTGEYVFIELNPNGQFLWLAAQTQLPLAEAMAHLLATPEDFRLETL